MSRVALSPRVLPPDAVRVPVHAPGYRPAVAYVLLGVVGAVLLGIALIAQQPGFRIFLAALGVLVLVGIPVGATWARALRAGVVQVDPQARGLRFAPSPAMPATMIVAALVGVLAGALPFVLGALGLPTSVGSGLSRFSPLVLGLVALGWLGYQLWGLRDPVGLTLTPDGLRGVRGGAHVALAWEQLERVEPRAHARGARLVLLGRDGSAIPVEPHGTGSDPNLVAAIVTHFQQHPADRGALVDGLAAIRRVEAAVSPTV